ncbi:hypothetical protein H1Y64_004756 [Salmonella enterica]|nr:hypothetical protein [Salmonella enterica]EHF2473765.1 hypothetical protein [Salmonella enterica subsp. enterica serovar Pensacola]EFP5438880.1 hypothetical protein [Salmonella enterica]EFR9853715.1 hypothetical protein [Salmonella enterica]EFV1304512.1 hypothetical protein [Salmonella enterica]
MLEDVFPAPAGINRQQKAKQKAHYCVPRASRDKPNVNLLFVIWIMCSPRQRG